MPFLGELSNSGENFARRHMTSSQRAMVTIERRKTDPDFAAQCELLEQEAKDRQKAGKKNLVETIPQGSEHDRKTSTVLAKASGTNRKYLELAEKIFDEHPEYVEPIKRGEKTVTQANREITKATKLARVAELPADKYRVIYADPRWSYGNPQSDYHGEQRRFPLTRPNACLSSWSRRKRTSHWGRQRFQPPRSARSL